MTPEITPLKRDTKIHYASAFPFLLFHLSLIGIFFTGVSVTTLSLAFILYVVRMFAVTGVYHRYFSHKSYKTSRFFQFCLAFLAQTSAQQGAIWWANHHRQHHIFSDTDYDVHSPRRQGFWYAHMGWIFSNEFISHDYKYVKDWEAYPELVWLDKHRYLPAILLGLAVYLGFGLQGLFVGFVLSTVVLYHGTFSINSLSHVYGKQRYLTGDDSRNNWLLAIITLGEGWHNNHHHYSTCTRQGFRWWEIDITYYIIKGLEKLHLVWDVREPPKHIVTGWQTIPEKVKQRTQGIILSVVSIDKLSSNVAELADKVGLLAGKPTLQSATIRSDIDAMLVNLKAMLAEKMHALEALPPKIAAITKEKFNQLASLLDNTKQLAEDNQLWQHFKKSLEDIAQSLQLIPDRIPVKSV